VVAAVGFDQLLSSWATFALDVLSEWQVGENELKLPGPVQVVAPLPNALVRTIEPTIIPDRKDNRVDVSLGAKLTSAGGFTVVTNAVIPVNHGGMRADAVWTAGVEYAF